MLHRAILVVPVAVMILALAACDGGVGARSPQGGTGPGNQPSTTLTPLYAQANPGQPNPAPPRRANEAMDPIVVPECRLVTFEKQDVPSQRDGVILTMMVKEGDVVQAKQQLAQLDNRVAKADLASKAAKISAGKADQQATIKTKEESYQRWLTAKGQVQLKAMSREEERGAELTYQRYRYEEVSKTEAVTLAELEYEQSKIVLEMHQLSSTCPGVIKAIYKKPGEAVKNLEPVFQVHNYDRLRVEALVDEQYLPYLRKGMQVVIEPSQQVGPQQTLVGHMQEVTGVAVSNDAKAPAIVSASDDGTVRVWDRAQRRARLVFRHPAAVKAVTCTPRGAPANLCLSGAADGRGRLWNLAGTSEEALRELKGQHRGPITCVAFTPDGKTCATGGEDREIRLWDVASGDLRYALPAGHRGAITSLQFTPHGQLVSTGRDNTLRLWAVGTDTARLETTLDRRSGDVTALGASPDGKRVLFDHGKSLRILSLPRGLTESVLQNPAGASNFTTFALFSPDSRLILTAGASEGRVQLWHAPDATHRAHELRQFVGTERSAPTCAAFSPDGSFVVGGTRERHVQIWPVPSAKDIDEQYVARVTLIDRSVDTSARQVRVWAELDNPGGKLLAGATVTMVINPIE